MRVHTGQYGALPIENQGLRQPTQVSPGATVAATSLIPSSASAACAAAMPPSATRRKDMKRILTTLLAFGLRQEVICDEYGDMGERRKINRAEAVEMMYIKEEAAEEARPMCLINTSMPPASTL